MGKEFLSVEGLSDPRVISKGTTAHMTAGHQAGPSDNGADGDEIRSANKTNRLKSILTNDVFKTKDKLQRLADVENSKSLETDSDDALQLGKWDTYVKMREAVDKNVSLSPSQKKDALKALKDGLLYSSREPLVQSNTTPNLRAELEGSTIDRRRSVGATGTASDPFSSPPAKRFSKLTNLFKKKD